MTEDLHALSGAYVMDAVDDIERAAFVRHMAACEACATEVAEFREVASRLGALAEQAPPPDLRANVLAATRGAHQLSPAGPPQREAGPAERPSRAAGLAGFHRGGASSPARPDQRWRRTALAIAAAAVVALAVTYTVMDQRVRHERSQVQALQADQARVYAVMNAKDVQMRGADLPQGGRLAAAVSASEHEGVAMFAGLPAPPSGDTYQMWLIGDGKVTSALVLPVGVLGGTALFTWTPGANTFGVTVEKAGGATAPSTAPLATIALS